MRKKVVHYQGKEITEEVIKTICIIAIKRYDESPHPLTHEGINNLSEMCQWHNTIPFEENVILGEDWYIIYANRLREIEILEWVSIGKVPNKLEQTIEMLNEFKKVLLLSENRKVSTHMHHLTSYPFYEKLLKAGYFEEIYNYPQIEHNIVPGSKEAIEEIVKKYGSLYEYLKSNNKEYQYLEQCIYHDINFKITTNFIKRYQKRK